MVLVGLTVQILSVFNNIKTIITEKNPVVKLSKMNFLTQSIRDLNEFIRNDKRVDISMLPIADGVTFCYKK